MVGGLRPCSDASAGEGAALLFAGRIGLLRSTVMSPHHQEFLGDQIPPDTLAEVQARRPVLGTGARPDELQEVAMHRVSYVPSTDAPQVRVERVEGESLWRVAVPVDSHFNGVRPLRALRRVPAETIAREIDSKTSFTGFRPSWSDIVYVPRRPALDRSDLLRRFNGTRVTPLWVFGRDDRWAFRDPAWPWGLVGRIFNSEGYSGTGALVGDRIVVTAGHMVPWKGKDPWMRFVPAYYDGTSLYGAGVESDAAEAYGIDTGGHVAGYDWAILRLFDPLDSWLGYFGYNGYAEPWEDQPWWSVIGYPGAIANANRPSFQGGVSVTDLDSDDAGGAELESDTADISSGDSGGPMFG
ncbi:trypsin-like serine peptidase [Streptomyces sp. NPDC007983]|uniref:trypsin-like serine peptidase n=1 Tax=Streptomyces sp. NPDC007983 TaxID=3364800 RepID=UPI0036EA274C